MEANPPPPTRILPPFRSALKSVDCLLTWGSACLSLRGHESLGRWARVVDHGLAVGAHGRGTTQRRVVRRALFV